MLRAIRFTAHEPLLVVEHNMSLVMGVADNILGWLDSGGWVPKAPPAEIARQLSRSSRPISDGRIESCFDRRGAVKSAGYWTSGAVNFMPSSRRPHAGEIVALYRRERRRKIHAGKGAVGHASLNAGSI